jgi:hypothetical protein
MLSGSFRGLFSCVDAGDRLLFEKYPAVHEHPEKHIIRSAAVIKQAVLKFKNATMFLKIIEFIIYRKETLGKG